MFLANVLFIANYGKTYSDFNIYAVNTFFKFLILDSLKTIHLEHREHNKFVFNVEFPSISAVILASVKSTNSEYKSAVLK